MIPSPTEDELDDFIASMQWQETTPAEIRDLVIGNVRGFARFLQCRNEQRQPFYLFIAKKEDSVDYCRGHRVASYSADFCVENTLTREKLVEIWAKYLHKNMNLDCNESGYEFLVFRDGIKVYDRYPMCDLAERYGYNSDEYYAAYSMIEAAELAANQEVTAIFAEANEVAVKLQGAQVTAQQKKQAEEAAQAAEKAKQERLAQFKKLQVEFGGQT